MDRFYWLEDGRLAGCSRPGGAGTGSPGWNGRGADSVASDEVARLDEDLSWLGAQGIGALLSLTELPLDETAMVRHDIACLHIPVPDLTAPLPEQFHRALEFIDWHRATGRAVAVHCLQGQGRTGSILAAHMIRSGSAADGAIAALRDLCPGAIGTPEQESALHSFAARKDWVM